MINLYKTGGVITVGEDGKVPVTYYGEGGKSGKFYPVKIKIDDAIIIGTQTWALRNLDVAFYNNGDPIPEVQDPTAWAALTTGAWCYYNNDPANGKIYGKLYNWHAVNDARGLAPTGYHIPSTAEMDTLKSFLDPNAGGQMKELGFNHWDSPNTGASNSSGFTGLGAGYRDNATFGALLLITLYWTSDEIDLNTALCSYLFYNDGELHNEEVNPKTYGFSVRCIKESYSSDFINLYNDFLINLGGDYYSVKWYDLVIDGTSPTSFSNANDLLLTFFS
jgi:uncharacterized protein (TIGR02145 family)